MNTLKSMLLVGLALMTAAGLTGCSSLTVNYDYDNNVDWTNFKTYAWVGAKSTGSATASGGVMDSGLLDQRIRSSVEFEMTSRAMTESTTPDVLVIYHVGSEDKIQVTDWGYRYSDYYWGYGGRQIDVYQFTEGTLVIDIIDAGTKNLVWRGTGSGVVDQTQRTPEEIQEDIDKVVNKIMASFPPK